MYITHMHMRTQNEQFWNKNEAIEIIELHVRLLHVAVDEWSALVDVHTH